ncbi:HAD family phosphatase [Candidatus Woesearchaeota archaeon]|nr:HAD family phosphatase [Candidatus Woesearchaeota archaeon]
MIKAVIFDLDGVLIQSQELHRLAWNKELERFGLSFTKEEFQHYFGLRGQEIVRKKFTISGKQAPEDIPTMIFQKNAYFRQIAENSLEPLPGAKELLQNLKRQNYKTALGTSAPRENVEFFMKKTGLGKYLDGYACADDVSKGKPEPEVFLKAAEKIGAKPAECVVIEDARHGIQAAKKAGMKCIAVATTHPAEDLKQADIIEKDMSTITVEKIRGLND